MSDRSLRGMRLGAQSMETESGVEPAPRQRVEYRCEDGEQVFVTFSSEAEIPPVWVSKTGKEALLVDGERPDTSNDKAVRTHWDMLLERRSLPELEQILEDRLTILRERRGERRSAEYSRNKTMGPPTQWAGGPIALSTERTTAGLAPSCG
jgi:hypothetical protein